MKGSFLVYQQLVQESAGGFNPKRISNTSVLLKKKSLSVMTKTGDKVRLIAYEETDSEVDGSSREIGTEDCKMPADDDRFQEVLVPDGYYILNVDGSSITLSSNGTGEASVERRSSRSPSDNVQASHPVIPPDHITSYHSQSMDGRFHNGPVYHKGSPHQQPSNPDPWARGQYQQVAENSHMERFAYNHSAQMWERITIHSAGHLLPEHKFSPSSSSNRKQAALTNDSNESAYLRSSMPEINMTMAPPHEESNTRRTNGSLSNSLVSLPTPLTSTSTPHGRSAPVSPLPPNLPMSSSELSLSLTQPQIHRLPLPRLPTFNKSFQLHPISRNSHSHEGIALPKLTALNIHVPIPQPQATSWHEDDRQMRLVERFLRL